MKNLHNLTKELNKNPHLVPEYIEARVEWMNAKQADVPEKWKAVTLIYQKHYQRDNGSGAIPISAEAKALARIFPEEFPSYKPEKQTA